MAFHISPGIVIFIRASSIGHKTDTDLRVLRNIFRTGMQFDTGLFIYQSDRSNVQIRRNPEVVISINQASVWIQSEHLNVKCFSHHQLVNVVVSEGNSSVLNLHYAAILIRNFSALPIIEYSSGGLKIYVICHVQLSVLGNRLGGGSTEKRASQTVKRIIVKGNVLFNPIQRIRQLLRTGSVNGNDVGSEYVSGFRLLRFIKMFIPLVQSIYQKFLIQAVYRHSKRPFSVFKRPILSIVKQIVIIRGDFRFYFISVAAVLQIITGNQILLCISSVGGFHAVFIRFRLHHL